MKQLTAALHIDNALKFYYLSIIFHLKCFLLNFIVCNKQQDISYADAFSELSGVEYARSLVSTSTYQKTL